MDNKKGLVLVNTGNGKGKTTAAFGMALRAAGHGMRVLVLQFIKGPWKSGEVRACRDIPLIEVEALGKGFIKFRDGKFQVDDKMRSNAQKSIAYAREKVFSGSYDMVVLDEINNMVDYGLADVSQVQEIISGKPDKLILVLTGRNVNPEVVGLADTVTEMKAVKHAFDRGIKAKKGIEY